MMKVYGVRWLEFNRNDQPVGKEKTFTSETAYRKFLERLTGKDNFYMILATMEEEKTK